MSRKNVPLTKSNKETSRVHSDSDIPPALDSDSSDDVQPVTKSVPKPPEKTIPKKSEVVPKGAPAKSTTLSTPGFKPAVALLPSCAVVDDESDDSDDVPSLVSDDEGPAVSNSKMAPKRTVAAVKPSPARLVPAKPAQTASINKHAVSVDIDDMPGLVDSDEDDDAVRSKPVKSGVAQKPTAAKPISAKPATAKVTAPPKVSALPKVSAPPAKVAVTAKSPTDEEPPPLVDDTDEDDPVVHRTKPKTSDPMFSDAFKKNMSSAFTSKPATTSSSFKSPTAVPSSAPKVTPQSAAKAPGQAPKPSKSSMVNDEDRDMPELVSDESGEDAAQDESDEESEESDDDVAPPRPAVPEPRKETQEQMASRIGDILFKKNRPQPEAAPPQPKPAAAPRQAPASGGDNGMPALVSDDSSDDEPKSHAQKNVPKSSSQSARPPQRAESDDDADSGSDEDEQYDARRRAYKAPAPRKARAPVMPVRKSEAELQEERDRKEARRFEKDRRMAQNAELARRRRQEQERVANELERAEYDENDVVAKMKYQAQHQQELLVRRRDVALGVYAMFRCGLGGCRTYDRDIRSADSWVLMQCSDGCIIRLHKGCYKKFCDSLKKLGLQELNQHTRCITPECKGHLSGVQVFEGLDTRPKSIVIPPPVPVKRVPPPPQKSKRELAVLRRRAVELQQSERDRLATEQMMTTAAVPVDPAAASKALAAAALDLERQRAETEAKLVSESITTAAAAAALKRAEHERMRKMQSKKFGQKKEKGAPEGLEIVEPVFKRPEPKKITVRPMGVVSSDKLKDFVVSEQPDVAPLAAAAALALTVSSSISYSVAVVGDVSEDAAVVGGIAVAADEVELHPLTVAAPLQVVLSGANEPARIKKKATTRRLHLDQFINDGQQENESVVHGNNFSNAAEYYQAQELDYDDSVLPDSALPHLYDIECSHDDQKTVLVLLQLDPRFTASQLRQVFNKVNVEIALAVVVPPAPVTRAQAVLQTPSAGRCALVQFSSLQQAAQARLEILDQSYYGRRKLNAQFATFESIAEILHHFNEHEFARRQQALARAAAAGVIIKAVPFLSDPAENPAFIHEETPTPLGDGVEIAAEIPTPDVAPPIGDQFNEEPPGPDIIVGDGNDSVELKVSPVLVKAVSENAATVPLPPPLHPPLRAVSQIFQPVGVSSKTRPALVKTAAVFRSMVTTANSNATAFRLQPTSESFQPATLLAGYPSNEPNDNETHGSYETNLSQSQPSDYTQHGQYINVPQTAAKNEYQDQPYQPAAYLQNEYQDHPLVYSSSEHQQHPSQSPEHMYAQPHAYTQPYEYAQSQVSAQSLSHRFANNAPQSYNTYLPEEVPSSTLAMPTQRASYESMTTAGNFRANAASFTPSSDALISTPGTVASAGLAGVAVPFVRIAMGVAHDPLIAATKGSMFHVADVSRGSAPTPVSSTARKDSSIISVVVSGSSSGSSSASNIIAPRLAPLVKSASVFVPSALVMEPGSRPILEAPDQIRPFWDEPGSSIDQLKYSSVVGQPVNSKPLVSSVHTAPIAQKVPATTPAGKIYNPAASFACSAPAVVLTGLPSSATSIQLPQSYPLAQPSPHIPSLAQTQLFQSSPLAQLPQTWPQGQLAQSSPLTVNGPSISQVPTTNAKPVVTPLPMGNAGVNNPMAAMQMNMSLNLQGLNPIQQQQMLQQQQRQIQMLILQQQQQATFRQQQQQFFASSNAGGTNQPIMNPYLMTAIPAQPQVRLPVATVAPAVGVSGGGVPSAAVIVDIDVQRAQLELQIRQMEAQLAHMNL